MGENQKELRGLYIRVSTDAQAEEGYSIGAQQERLEAYCTAMGWSKYRLYVDPGYSGSNLCRPAMERLISDAESGELATVVVFKLDRLSRSQKDTLYLIEDVFLPNGVDFVSLNESIDTSTPYGRAMIGILSAFAQLERENIYLRTRMGMLERVKKGYWMGGGGTPFGYSYDSGTGILVPKPEEAEQVRRIFQLYIAGESCGSIARLLGIPYERQVWQILHRKAYLGVITYKGQEYPGRHRPIIEEEQYHLAQLKMEDRSTRCRTAGDRSNLLTGLVFCAQCGSRMRYIRWGAKGYKLMCYTRDKSKPHMHRGEKCTAEAVWAQEIEDAVVADLFSVSADLGEETERADPLAELQKRRTKLESQLRRLYRLYAQGGDELLLNSIHELKEELRRCQERCEEEEATHRRGEYLEQLRGRVTQIRDTWPLLTQKEKQQLVRECVDHVVVGENRTEIFYTFHHKE